MQSLFPEAKINEFDFAGRTAYGKRNLGLKHKVQKIIYKSPRFVAYIFFLTLWFAFTRKAVHKHWAKTLQHDGILVIGGGQLLMDDTLNFPLKISALVKFAASRNYKIVFNACGVSKDWSWLARKLFQKALSNPNITSISVRDEQSLQNLKKHVGKSLKVPPTLTVDPAVWSKDVYNKQLVTKTNNIGLGVAHPLELARMAENPEDFSVNKIAQFWCDIASKISKSGNIAEIFTNGSEEDQKFLEVVTKKLTEQNIKHKVIERAQTDEELVAQISSFKSIIAHRLHANIIAFALEKPHCGLIWDNKVRAFSKVSAREEFFIDSSKLDANSVYACLENAQKVSNKSPKLITLKELAMTSLKNAVNTTTSDKVYVIRDGMFTLSNGEPASAIVDYDRFSKRYLDVYKKCCACRAFV